MTSRGSYSNISIGENSLSGHIRDNSTRTNIINDIEHPERIPGDVATSNHNQDSPGQYCIAINGGTSSGESSIAIGSYKGTHRGYSNATNVGSLSIG